MANASNTRKATTNTTVDTTVDDSAVVNSVEEKVVTKKVENIVPLKDDDEIEVISLIPNVSYKDNKNNDFYEWNEVDHIETMVYSTLKDMNRNYKSYFKDLWLKPLDNRVIKALGLESTYKNYSDLMDGSFYKQNNIELIKEKFESLPTRGITGTIITKVKNMITSGEISDVKVVKNLERILHVDLFELLDL